MTSNMGYEGHVDRIENCWIFGWAWRHESPDEPVSVDLYVDDRREISTVAGAYRADLEQTGKGNGRHAFEITLPEKYCDGQAHSIRLCYHGTNADLYGSPQTVCFARKTAQSYEVMAAHRKVQLDERVRQWARDNPRNIPKISVIMPCYNLGRYLDEAVDSVFDQTFQDFEIIIVNDGSSDSLTNELLKEYNRPKVRVIAAEHKGVMHARNLAIEHARGECICALDADDVLERTYFEKAVKLLDEDDSVAFVSCWLKTFGDEEWIWQQDRCDLVALLGECTVATPSLVRKSALMVVGGYDASMPEQGYEDWDLWISLVEKGFSGKIIPEVLFFYRRRADSVSRACEKPETHLLLLRYMIEKHQKSYRQHLVNLLIRKENESCDLLKAAYAKERRIDSWLTPLQRWRQEELARMTKKLDAEQIDPRLGSALHELERNLHFDFANLRKAAFENAEMKLEALRVDAARKAVENEIHKLRHSRSWRITAPLRSINARLTGLMKMATRRSQ